MDRAQTPHRCKGTTWLGPVRPGVCYRPSRTSPRLDQSVKFRHQHLMSCMGMRGHYSRQLAPNQEKTCLLEKRSIEIKRDNERCKPHTNTSVGHIDLSTMSGASVGRLGSSDREPTCWLPFSSRTEAKALTKGKEATCPIAAFQVLMIEFIACIEAMARSQTCQQDDVSAHLDQDLARDSCKGKLYPEEPRNRKGRPCSNTERSMLGPS